jgi:hypothetical protein
MTVKLGHKMMRRSDIEFRLKLHQKQMKELMNECPKDSLTQLRIQYLTGYIEALKDVLG